MSNNNSVIPVGKTNQCCWRERNNSAGRSNAKGRERGRIRYCRIMGEEKEKCAFFKAHSHILVHAKAKVDGLPLYPRPSP
jgi:hypothetical protein